MTAEMPPGRDIPGVRVGLAAMCASRFQDIRLQDEFSHLAAILKKDFGTMVSFLGECAGRDVDVCTVVLASKLLQSSRPMGRSSRLLGKPGQALDA